MVTEFVGFSHCPSFYAWQLNQFPSWGGQTERQLHSSVRQKRLLAVTVRPPQWSSDCD